MVSKIGSALWSLVGSDGSSSWRGTRKRALERSVFLLRFLYSELRKSRIPQPLLKLLVLTFSGNLSSYSGFLQNTPVLILRGKVVRVLSNTGYHGYSFWWRKNVLVLSCLDEYCPTPPQWEIRRAGFGVRMKDYYDFISSWSWILKC